MGGISSLGAMRQRLEENLARCVFLIATGIVILGLLLVAIPVLVVTWGQWLWDWSWERRNRALRRLQ